MFMTTAERFAYADEIEHRALANLTNAVMFLNHPPCPYVPNFTMFPEPEIYHMPNPADRRPTNKGIYIAGVTVGGGIVAVSLVVSLALYLVNL